MSIGKRLKFLRSQDGRTQSEIAEALHNIGIAATRVQVARWENELQEPTLTPVRGLAKIYGVSLDWLITGEGKHGDRIANTASLKKLAAAYASINAEGKERVASYAEDLSHSGNYKLNASISIEEEAAQYISVIGSAAAGAGFAYADDVERLVTAVSAPPHDFAIDVKGDSMFPTIFDGDVAFVVKACDKTDRQIYVLDIDGETVIKRCVFEADALELISDNPDWTTRRVTGRELESTRILGRVVGWQSAV